VEWAKEKAFLNLTPLKYNIPRRCRGIFILLKALAFSYVKAGSQLSK
jgi:hypothetical protein